MKEIETRTNESWFSFSLGDTIILLLLTYFKNLCHSLFISSFYLISLNLLTVCDRHVLVLRIKIDRELYNLRSV